MKRFIEGIDRVQGVLFPDCLEDWIGEDNPVRVIDVFVAELDLGDLGFERVARPATGRPAYYPAILLKLYIYGYLNRVQSSRRLEREAGRNVEVMWLTGRLAPDHKTIAGFRKDNGTAIRKVCSRFVVVCRQLNLFAEASVAIDGSKFKAVNNRDRNFTRAKMQRRMAQIEESVERYLRQLDSADRQEPSQALARWLRASSVISIWYLPKPSSGSARARVHPSGAILASSASRLARFSAAACCFCFSCSVGSGSRR